MPLYVLVAVFDPSWNRFNVIGEIKPSQIGLDQIFWMTYPLFLLASKR